MNKRVTIPPTPWEAPLEAATRSTDPLTVKPSSPGARRLVAHAFNGDLRDGDLINMARAILQMADELHELRERVRRLEGG